MLNRIKWRLRYIRYWLWATFRRIDKLDWRTFVADEEYALWFVEQDWSEYDDDPGWLCWCGHWQDDGLCCESCGNQPAVIVVSAITTACAEPKEEE